jgi:hypothetical protein
MAELALILENGLAALVGKTLLEHQTLSFGRRWLIFRNQAFLEILLSLCLTRCCIAMVCYANII